MKKSTKRIVLALSIFLCLQPCIYADSKLNQEIAELEVEIGKMNLKAGEYADMTEKQLEKKKSKAKKDLEKKKEKAKKEAAKDLEKAKKSIKNAGEDIKNAGKDIKDAGKDIGNDVKEAGKGIGNAFKGLFD